jgi:histidinol-phosphate aminotransferase
MPFDLDRLVRGNIKQLVPYSSARSEFAAGGVKNIFLDANENAFGSPLPANLNRYPDPLQRHVKERIAEINKVRPAQIFIGNGSDEAIDLLFRIFCTPGVDEAIICPPTYGMFEVSAAINGVSVKRCDLTPGFGLDLERIKDAWSDRTKIIFLCSPNNPTGNLLAVAEIEEIVRTFDGIVVVDEAYIHFANAPSLVQKLDSFPNLVVLQTFSKAWGLAGLRVGLAFASESIIDLFNKVKPPYNVSQIAQDLLIEAIENREVIDRNIRSIISEREDLARDLPAYRFVEKVYPSAANFLLIKASAAHDIYNFLLNESIVVRDRSRVMLCEGCLRITVGTPDENRMLLGALERYEASSIH